MSGRIATGDQGRALLSDTKGVELGREFEQSEIDWLMEHLPNVKWVVCDDVSVSRC